MSPRAVARRLRGLFAVPVLAFVILTFAPQALAAPAHAPYPDVSHYKIANSQLFRVTDEAGVWFTTPLGVRCAIEDDASYGCSGELPGAPPGENEIAWFVGDPFPRLYHAEVPRFSSDAGQTIAFESTYIDYRGSRCAVTRESAVYCIHGDDPNSQLMVTSGMTFRGSAAVPST